MRRQISAANTKYPKLARFLDEAILRWRIKPENSFGTIRDLALECQVGEVAMGRYIAGIAKPSPAAQDQIASVLGVGIYEACDAPIRLPKDNGLQRMILHDWHILTKDERKDVLDLALQYAERRREVEKKIAGKVA